jgi:hypothetical protein
MNWKADDCVAKEVQDKNDEAEEERRRQSLHSRHRSVDVLDLR